MPDEIRNPETPSGRSSPANLAKGQEASLGCGTLILIAMIVMICSGRGSDNREWKQELGGLQTEVKQLQKSVQEQTGLILQIKEQVDKLKIAK